MPGVGSSSPAVLIAHLAAATSTIRVGSGGVMLPNHQPLVIAEQFGTLDALHPDRIDLGIGRAPGTDPRTARALRRGTGPLGADDFPEQLTELSAYFRGEGPVLAVPAAGPAARAVAAGVERVQRAGRRACSGCRSRSRTTSAARTRSRRSRSTARRSGRRRCSTRPYAMIGASVLAADTDAEARRLALPSALQFLRLRQGAPGLVPTPDEAAAYPYTDEERRFVEDRLAGPRSSARPTRCGTVCRSWSSAPGVDELMVVTSAHDGADRLRSYELLAKAVAPATV